MSSLKAPFGEETFAPYGEATFAPALKGVAQSGYMLHLPVAGLQGGQGQPVRCHEAEPHQARLWGEE